MRESLSEIYGSSFYAATMAERRDYPRLNGDLDVDVCVVGGGLAGLTAAREVARRGWSVVLLEAKRIAWNASGRNSGFVLPGFAQIPEIIVKRAGAERARDLWRLSEEGVAYVRQTIAETAMPGVSPEKGWLWITKTDQPEMMSAEADYMRQSLGAEVEYWPTDRVRSQFRSERYFQAIHYPTAFHVHPLNYALGLARAAEEAGVRIFEETPALSFDPAGVRKRVQTSSARVRAAHVVLAGNVHLGDLMPQLSRTLLPITTYLVATKPLGDRLAEAMSCRAAVSDTEWADNHYRPTPDNRLIWSGRMTTWPSNPRFFTGALRRDIARTYPQLGKVDIEFAWNGTLGNTVHRMPQIGEVSSGLWLASGFGGHGFNTTALAGNLIARAIVEGDKTWQAFSPFELVWAGGVTGRAVTQASYVSHRITEGARSFVSRWRGHLRRHMAKASRDDGAPETQGVVDESETPLAPAASAETMSPAATPPADESAPKS